MSNPFAGMMQNIQKLQTEMKKAQQELAHCTIVGEAGAGLVKITANGNGHILSILIDDSVYQDGKQVLQDLIAAASNDVNSKRERLKNEKAKQAVADMGLPVNFNFPFMS